MTEARIFLSAGEISGDQHAAGLLTELRRLLPGLAAEGLGGPQLAAAGCHLHADLVQKAIFGLRGAAEALPRMLGLLTSVAAHFDKSPPDVVVIVDYPGLNLHLARLARSRGIPVVAFIAPQLWAWAPWRARRFARAVDEALVMFPFEVPFFARAGLPAQCIGHPLLDRLPQDAAGHAALLRPAISARPAPVALLPGSRPREVTLHTPWFAQAARIVAEHCPQVSFHAAHVSAEQRERMAAIARAEGLDLHLHGDDVHGVMASCRAALIASGTATLEAALLGTPQVIAYRVSRLELGVMRRLAVTPWIGQANLLLGRAVSPEIVQAEPEPEELAFALLPLLGDTPEWRSQRQAFGQLRLAAGGPGALRRAAQHLARRLSARRPTPAR